MSELQFSKQFLTTLDNKATKYQPDHVFDPKTFATRVPYTLPKLSSPPHPSIPISPSTSSSLPTTTTATDPSSSPSEPPMTLTLNSTRNPNMSLTLPTLPPSSTTISQLKAAIQTHLGGPSVVHVDKIKIILNKKPIPSSKKTLADAFADTPELLQKGGDVSLSVMVMGGAPDPPPASQASQASQTTPGADATAAAVVVGPGSEKAAAEKSAADADAGAMEGVEEGTGSTNAVDDELAGPLFWSDLQAFLAQRLKVEEGKAGELRGVFERAWRSSEEKP